MSELPARLSPGQRLTAHWLNRLLDFLRARELRPGPGIRLQRTPSGTTIGATIQAEHGSAAAGDAVIGIVETASYGSAGSCVLVRLYPKGASGPRGELVQLHAPCVFRRAPFVEGDAVLCHPAAVTTTGEGEAEEREED